MAFTKEERLHAAGVLFNLTGTICDPSSLLVITEVETGRGATDYFNVTLYYTDDNGVIQDRNLSFLVAAATGKNMRGRRDEFGVSGYGMSKHLQIAMNLYHVLNLPETGDVSREVQGIQPVFNWRER